MTTATTLLALAATLQRHHVLLIVHRVTGTRGCLGVYVFSAQVGHSPVPPCAAPTVPLLPTCACGEGVPEGARPSDVVEQSLTTRLPCTAEDASRANQETK